MDYQCPDCQGIISIADTSSATVYVCPHCSKTGNMGVLRTADAMQAPPASPAPPVPPAPVPQDPAPQPPAGVEPPSAGFSAAGEALEPITGATPPPGLADATMDYFPTSPAPEVGNDPFLQEFSQGNIFDQVDDQGIPGPPAGNAVPTPPPGTGAIPNPGTGPVPAPGTGAVPIPPVSANQTMDVECPICKATNIINSDGGSNMHNCSSCGSLFSPGRPAPADSPPPTDDLVGQTIGGCMVVNRVGEGGMGTVYKGMQVSLDREVAIKILPRQYSRNNSFIQRFEREAKALAKINHQNIMQIYDFGMHGDLYYMIMEFINGASLSDYLEEKFVVPIEEALIMIKQAAQGLECAAKNGVIHRDVKPDNIMIDERDVVKMTDFGLAKMVGSGVAELTQEGVRVGTPAFMSPEQCKGQKSLDVRTDIYSLGVTFYFALSGKLPFTGDSPFSIMLKHQNQKATPLNNLVPGLPDAVSEIVERMMEKEPDDRYQNWMDFLDAIGAVERFMAVSLPDASDSGFHDAKADMQTRDIDVQKHADDLPEDWGQDETGPADGVSTETAAKMEELNQLMLAGDSHFSAGNYDDAINVWQKALFVDPNNIEIQDKISEARSRLRQKKIEDMLAEANELEKRGKYKAALNKLDEMAKMKLTWQVKDMVGKSLTRIQGKMKKRKMMYNVFRAIILFIALMAAVIVVWPFYMTYRAQQAYDQASMIEQEAIALIETDFERYRIKAQEAIGAFRKIKGYQVPQDGIMGMIFGYLKKENEWVPKAEERAIEIEVRMEQEQVQYTIRVALEEVDKLTKVGKYIQAEEKLEQAVAAFGKESPEFEQIKEQYESIKATAAAIKALHEKAVTNDVFEAAPEAAAKLSYANMEIAVNAYQELIKTYPETVLGLKAKAGFTIDSNPAGADVTIILAGGREIVITDKRTPLTIPIDRPNKLFTVRLTKLGYKPVEKKFRESTLDRSSEMFKLDVGPIWIGQTSERNPISSQIVFKDDEIIVLAHSRIHAIKEATGKPAWDEENYVVKNSAVISPLFDNSLDMFLAGDTIVVPGNAGQLFRIEISNRKPGEWLRTPIDISPIKKITGLMAITPGTNKSRPNVYFAEKESSLVGAIRVQEGTPLWLETAPAEEGAEASPWREVVGHPLQAPIYYRNNILLHTDKGYVYHIDSTTGDVRNRVQVPTACDTAVITVHEDTVYYVGSRSNEEKTFVYKINILTGELAWTNETAGIVENGSPVIVDNKLVFAMQVFDKGSVIALNLSDGQIAWTFPEKQTISPIGQGITLYKDTLFCPSGTNILIISKDGQLLHDEYETQYGKITRKLIVRDNAIYCVTGYGLVYKFILPPQLKLQ